MCGKSNPGKARAFTSVGSLPSIRSFLGTPIFRSYVAPDMKRWRIRRKADHFSAPSPFLNTIMPISSAMPVRAFALLSVLMSGSTANVVAQERLLSLPQGEPVKITSDLFPVPVAPRSPLSYSTGSVGAMDRLQVLQRAIAHVKPHLPAGRTALYLDYEIGEIDDEGDSIRWVKPFELISPRLHSPALEALGAVPFSRDSFKWCASDKAVAQPGCFTAAVVITEPEIIGNEARLTIFWHTDHAEHERKFDFLMTRSDDRWAVTTVTDSDIWY